MLSIPKKAITLTDVGFCFKLGIPDYISLENLVHNPLLFRYVGQSDRCTTNVKKASIVNISQCKKRVTEASIVNVLHFHNVFLWP